MSLIKYAVFHPWRTVIVVVVGALLGTALFYTYTVSSALGNVAIEDFDPVRARDRIEASITPTTIGSEDFSIDVDSGEPKVNLGAEREAIETALERELDPREVYPTAFGTPISDSVFEAYLLVGADASGYLADAVILALQPTDGGAPIMVSLPRDLYLWNLCRNQFTRLNAGLGGCKGTASGSELLAIMVEDYTGIPIDHLARINFGGFARLVDAMGGIEVCVDAPSRDIKAHLDIPEPGCQQVDGETALAWVRSRRMEQLVDGEWVRIGGSDFGRQQRQQDVLFQMARRAAGFSSPGSLVERLSVVTSYVRLDSSWSFAQAVSTAWEYRGISKSSVKRFSIAVRNHRTPSGAAVLLPRVTFTEELSDVYPVG